MNKRFLTLAGVAAVLIIGTFTVLNKVKPYKQEEPKVADVTSADQVFGASVASPEAHTDGSAAASPATDTAAAAPADTAVQPASSDAAGTAPAPAAAPGAADSAPLVPAGPAGAAPAAAPADTASAAPAPAAEPAAPAAEPAPAPAPAAEPAAPAMDASAAPAEKPKKKAKAKSAAHKASKSESAKAWWPAEQADKLSLVYAGHASFKPAVVLMFNGAFFKADSVNANIKVSDKAGKAVAGTWELGENNRRMLVFPVAGPGTYKVSVAPGLTDNKGRKLGKKLSGPVVISK